MENNTNQKITTPVAIIVAGVLIMVGILLTRGNGGPNTEVSNTKTLSEQVGVKKEALDACMGATNLDDLYKTTTDSANIVMANIPATERGTPYSVLIGKDGTKVELRGNIPYDDYLPTAEATIKVKGVKSIVDSMIAGTATSDYTGEIPPPNENDHIIGSLNSPVIIVEYADLECPYCMRFSATAKRIVAESNGNVAWVYRHWVVHSDVSKGQNALPKAAASECVAKLKGNDAFWKYIDLTFGLMAPAATAPVTDNL